MGESTSGGGRAPSTTDRGIQFLTNFPASKREVARVLIDSLEFQTSDDLALSLEIAIDNLVAGHDRVALYPVRNLNDFTLNKTGRGKPRKEWTAFVDFDPSEDLALGSGSELAISSSLTRAQRRWPSDGSAHQVLLAPSIDELRHARVRQIVLVEDFSGSGKQCADYLGSWSNNRTIRSWHSGRLLRMSLVIGAASTETAAWLRENSFADEVNVRRFVDRAPFLRRTDPSHASVIELCRQYGNGHADALGYRNSFGLFVPGGGAVPNNIPWVLRRQGPNWNSLFVGPHGRTMDTAFQQEVQGYRPSSPERAYELWSSPGDRRPRRQWSRLYDILTSAQAGPTLIELETATSIPLSDLRQIIDSLEHLGLLNLSSRVALTADGADELAALERRAASKRLAPAAVTYYPWSVRGVGSI